METDEEREKVESQKMMEEKKEKEEASMETKDDEVDKDMGVWHDGHVARMAVRILWKRVI